ncbi:MAG TPA: adenylyl-sulfate kinase [Candidatus Eisenbergiella merdipullorum]|uniref:Adenylyl-sulfate kinase n=1 Tax=Candidatus Eisenbergiella merdipullorum TaxID=2838553 RepID=A0A9D2KXL6_9FIRM|nr:adenylyl-sulfate kinase [Candidatus Eisenbergiella merdipullorum]
MKDLLKFLTCGSVDDGKSTLIGHMLYDSKQLYADQEQALQLDSRVGSADGQIDYSLLLDGLMSEREQGITIDVAYRYFKTEARSYIVADAPGHEEYTRNMAVAASFAQLAVILIDASKGVQIQTRRHARICYLMGIRDMVFAVNKMDMVGYDRQRFKEIESAIHEMTEPFPLNSLAIIPVSATMGDNITEHSDRMPWYSGPSLLDYLDQVEIAPSTESTDFTMPVQRVCRPNSSFRGFQGQIESGSVRVGDEIRSLPSGETAVVTDILTGFDEVEEAVAGQPVTIQLGREIDISRGCVLVKGKGHPISESFTATLLWMDESPLMPGVNYILKLGTKMTNATVMDIQYKVDIHSGRHVPADRLYKNEIGVCNILVSEKIILDTFEKSQPMGGLILIDQVTNHTCAGGTVKAVTSGYGDLFWHDFDLTRDIRARNMGQNPLTIWFTGLSGSGKSTLANALEKRLYAMGMHTMVLDGDNIRLGLNRDLGFSEEDRIENIRRIAQVAKLMNDAGLIVLTAFISPFHRDRDNARKIIGDSFIEVYVNTPLEECERRDIKHLYQKARKGEIHDFTGISSPYEVPENPDITVDTTGRAVEACVSDILEKLAPYLKK